MRTSPALLLPGVALAIAAVTVGTAPVETADTARSRPVAVTTTAPAPLSPPGGAEVLGTSITRDQLSAQVAELRAQVLWLEAIVAAQQAAAQIDPTRK
jgi:hypothetical protein